MNKTDNSKTVPMLDLRKDFVPPKSTGWKLFKERMSRLFGRKPSKDDFIRR